MTCSSVDPVPMTTAVSDGMRPSRSVPGLGLSAQPRAGATPDAASVSSRSQTQQLVPSNQRQYQQRRHLEKIVLF